MSTRSNIILVIDEKDFGKTMAFNPELVGKPCVMEGTSEIPEVKIPEQKYMKIYHHWDGYPDGVGQTLLEEFNTYDKVLNLLLAGDESSINGNEIIPYHFWRNEDWDDVQPTFSENEPEFDVCIEWMYKFENGKWYVKGDAYSEVREWILLEDYEHINDCIPNEG